MRGFSSKTTVHVVFDFFALIVEEFLFLKLIFFIIQIFLLIKKYIVNKVNVIYIKNTYIFILLFYIGYHLFMYRS